MAGPASDFSALLDDIMSERDNEGASTAPASVDYMSVMEELHSGRIRFTEETVRQEYAAAEQPAPKPARRKIEPPSIDPAEVARELDIGTGRSVQELDRIRRDFAFRNHPDRVEGGMRQRAMVRMQIANMLIDEAKRTGRR